MTQRIPVFLLALIAIPILTQPTSSQEVAKAAPKGIEFFEKRIRPALVKYCYRCHSVEADKDRGGLVLDSQKGLLEGGDSGPALVPGDVKKSLLYAAVAYEHKDLQMPPSKKLPDDVIHAFKEWITMGAPDPRTEKKVAKEYGPAKDLWCLHPIKNAMPPKVKNEAWPKSNIDRFILAKLESAGLEPVEDAEPLTLLRRVHLDLIGLPPPPKTVDAFLDDPTAAHFEKIVDQLLASAQFGERWGRYWLDVARYAESTGMERDVLMPHAWRYRNYVIDAFNQDKPYDRFIIEQLAGDLLPASNAEERDRLNIATGFLAIGPKSFMQRGKQFQLEVVDEQIDATTRAFLGLTVSCARCHDHKFDPIPTADYHAMAGIFFSTKTLFGADFRSKGKDAQKNLQLLQGVEGVDLKKWAAYEKKTSELTKKVRNFTNRLKKLKRAKNKNPKHPNLIKTTQKRLKVAQTELKKLRNNAPPAPEFCMAVEEGKPQNLPIYIRGELRKPGKVVDRGFLSCVNLENEIEVNSKQSGRLQLAQWIADPSNPLTARVAVNRVWHHLFGRGIVRSVDNFGSNGKSPSHPELLDHLAHRFMAEGWSFKKLIRSIVLSRSYQLASAYSEKNYEVDPDNILVWKHTMRRLDVEAIRDGILAASGKLDLSQPEESVVAQIGNGEVGRGINTKPLNAPFFHRSVYLPILRTDLLEILKVFDFAEPSLVVGKRTITTVPAQALYMMNSAFVIDNAKAMAGRLLKASQMDNDEKTTLAYKLALGRLPTEKELQRVETFVNTMEQRLEQKYSNSQQRELFAWTTYCQALYASAEFRYLN